MRNLCLLIGFCFLTFCNSGSLFAQDTDDHLVQITIPEVALLDIEPNTLPIILKMGVPSEAGLPMAVAAGSNNSKWINYTCGIAPSGGDRIVTVQVTSGVFPVGVALTVQASVATSGGGGTKGVPMGLVTLDGTAKTLISGIGSCFTGDGSGSGHQLTYTLDIQDYSLLNFTTGQNLEITYTISD